MTTTCEDCNIELKTKAQWKKHFNLNHNLRTQGMFIIPDMNARMEKEQGK